MMQPNDSTLFSAPGNGEETIIVFYDGGCPLCRREINHYMKLTRDNLIHWVDISRDDSRLGQFTLSTDEAMRRFHVVDQMGNIARGAVAFLIMWQALPGYRHLANIIRFLHLTPLLELGYEWFAKRRYHRACGRQAGSCATVPGD